LSHNRAGLTGMLFCSFGLRVGVERAAKEHDRLDRIFVNTSVLGYTTQLFSKQNLNNLL